MIIILLLLYFWAVFEYPFSIEKLKTIKYIIAKTLYYLVFLFLTFTIIRSKHDLQKFIYAYTAGLFIGVLYTIFLHAADGFSFENINYISSIIFVNHVFYATVIGIGIPLTWFLLKTTPKFSVKRSFYLKFLLILFLFALITSYTRGSWLALIVCIIFYILLNYKKVTLTISIGVIVITCFVGYLFNNDRYLDYASDYTTTIFHEGDIEGHLAATYSLKDVSGMERIYRWVAGANMVKEKPIMGSGPGTFYPEYKKFAIDRFRTYVSNNPEQSTTHNNFLLFLTEQGLVGFLLFTTLVIMVFIRGSKIYNECSDPDTKHLTAGFYLAFTSIIVCMMFSDFTESDKVGSFFLVSITILAKINQWNKENQLKSL
ncbi:O-antigen ligase family protein [Sporocytophaga myxococcoides]|nr:O-antigen ligase family protein [Sporocytophaga myxococcoides]